MNVETVKFVGKTIQKRYICPAVSDLSSYLVIICLTTALVKLVVNVI